MDEQTEKKQLSHNAIIRKAIIDYLNKVNKHSDIPNEEIVDLVLKAFRIIV